MPSKLEHDRQFDVDQNLYDTYDKSSFSKQDKSEYDCMIDFFGHYKKETKYFLFGYEPSDLYNGTISIDQAIEKIKRDANFKVFAYNPMISTPNQLLSAFGAWFLHTEMTEEQYYKFKS
jgi:hypothetical protein